MSKHTKNSHKEEEKQNTQEVELDTEIVENVEDVEDVEVVEEADRKNTDESGDTQKKAEQYLAMMQRISADFDNYKKRAQKERESSYQDATAEAVQAFIPVLDNFERALKAQDVIDSDQGDSAFRKGLELLLRQFKESFVKLGVKEILSLGEKFDPNLHNAVMHIDDPSYGDGEIIEELQKGYLIGEKVIRHSMVKVAN